MNALLRRRLAAISVGMALVVAALLFPKDGLAAPKNEVKARALLDEATGDDYLALAFDKAEQKVSKAIEICTISECSPELNARLKIARGSFRALAHKDLDAAKKDYLAALRLDPNATLPDGFTGKELQTAFDAAKKSVVGEKVEPTKPAEEKSSDPPKPVEDKDKEEPKKISPLTESLHFEVDGYLDSTATETLTPSSSFTVENKLDGWGVTGGFLVDVVTAASTDIVATASPKWQDVRYAPTLDGHFKVGDTTLSLGGYASVESDYIAGGGHGGIAVDNKDKTITPSLSYAYGHDTAGRHGTPYSVYSRVLQTHAVQAAITFVLDKATIFVPNLLVDLEFGDQAKPYRWVPTFAPGTTLTPGESLAEVTKLRSGIELEERLPQSRQRYALAGLLAHRFVGATLRLEERLYVDSWRQLATTTDMLLPIDVGRSFRLTPHLRVHAQNGVSFWQLGYDVKETGGSILASGLRTGDRTFGPLLGFTGGLGMRIGSEDLSFSVTADAVDTYFLDQLYLTNRIGGLGQTMFDVRF